ncbi:MAG: type II toxin-antitoxin system RelE/ParE family toxin [Pseudomonadota bacterium]
MPVIRRSDLFKRQLLNITASYRDRAGKLIALKFVDQIEESVKFIANKPLACVIYTQLDGKEFRKWHLKSFPVSIFFCVKSPDTIILEALYSHRMNIAARLSRDTE